MGCFPACFTSSSKRQKHHNSLESSPSKDQARQTSEVLQLLEPAKRQENVGKLVELIKESKEKVEDQVLNCGAKKRVTFDLNVKAYEDSSAKEETARNWVGNNEDEKKSRNEETSRAMEPLFDTNALSNVITLNPNNRYEDCRKSTDEYEEIGLEESDLEEEEEDDDDDDDEDSEGYNEWTVVQESPESSLFSLSIDSRKQACDIEKGEKEVNSLMQIHSLAKDEVKMIGSCRDSGKSCRFGNSVLNPIDSLTQWKEVKERHIPQLVKHQDKENVGFKPSLKPANQGSKPKLREIKPTQQEIGVDTSLSSWLFGSENVSKSNCSNHSVGNSDPEKANSLSSPRNGQSLGGELAIDELKHYFRSSPATSRSQSPDATTPMIGTVGSYWVHTGQNVDLNSSSSSREVPITARGNREDQTVHCNSASFEARLDRALDMGIC